MDLELCRSDYYKGIEKKIFPPVDRKLWKEFKAQYNPNNIHGVRLPDRQLAMKYALITSGLTKSEIIALGNPYEACL